MRNKFNILQEIPERYIANNEYWNFVTIHLEAVSVCILIKPKIISSLYLIYFSSEYGTKGLGQNEEQKWSQYDWYSFANSHKSLQHTVRNKFNILQEISERYTANTEYWNFVTTHLEAVSARILIKPKIKYEVCWKSEVKEKIRLREKASLLNKRNPTHAN